MHTLSDLPMEARELSGDTPPARTGADSTAWRALVARMRRGGPQEVALLTRDGVVVRSDMPALCAATRATVTAQLALAGWAK